MRCFQSGIHKRDGLIVESRRKEKGMPLEKIKATS
jgi:hypothetical protein